MSRAAGLIALGITAIIFCCTFQLGSAQKSRRNSDFNDAGSKSVSIGCRNKVVGSAVLLGGVRACQSSKPLKPSGILKMGKLLCAEGWGVCSHKDKFVDQLSWKPKKMPAGCFAFRYGSKSKAAGYGKNCHSNLYFHGALCCPNHGHKVAQQKHHFLNINGQEQF